MTRTEAGDVRPFLDLDLYLVGLEDGRLRAIDGRVRSSGCVVEWRPDDPRAVAANPLGRRGAFVDPCTGATWALSGNQVQSAGTPEPLRTFAFVFATQPDGAQHVFIEVIGRPASTPEG